MLNKVSSFIRTNTLIQPGDRVICAVSGGADSIALLWALYLLKEKLSITVEAAHFNHRLRAEESDRDQQFVEEFCKQYDIPLHLGAGNVSAGEKGLEAAAREARYGFFETLSGKIATAHTADDNAETLLMHIIRGTGLKGLGGIAPARGNLIRPMLSVTRQEVLAFLEEYCLTFVEDSSNSTDQFLRNRIRHHVMPLLYLENPRISENMSSLALRLRQDNDVLETMAEGELPEVSKLREMPSALRSRYLSLFLEQCGVREPNSQHISLAESLVFSENPSARGAFPNDVVIGRCYQKLVKLEASAPFSETVIPCPGNLEIPQWGVRIQIRTCQEKQLKWDCFTVYPVGAVTVRTRKTGDRMRLQGGTKSLKEIMIDKKIPASMRDRIPVLADDAGILGVYGIGANLDRIQGNSDAVEIRFEEIE